MTDFHGRTLQPTGFEGDDGSADPALIEVLAAARRDEAGVYPAYAALVGRRVLVPKRAVVRWLAAKLEAARAERAAGYCKRPSRTIRREDGT